MGKLEAEIPGTRLFVSLLLTHELFKDHPLNVGTLTFKGAPVKQTPPWSWAQLEEGRNVPVALRVANAEVVSYRLDGSIARTVSELNNGKRLRLK